MYGSSKGLVLTTTKALVILLIIACVVSVYIIFNKVFYEFHILPTELQYRRNALILSVVLMGRDDLIYKDGAFLHAVFDAEKLDRINGKFLAGIGYPNSFTTVTIVDLENGKFWDFYVKPRGVKEKDWEKFLRCKAEEMKFSLINIPSPLQLVALIKLNIHKYLECMVEEELERGKFLDEFPVSISYGKDVHIGKMLVSHVEW